MAASGGQSNQDRSSQLRQLSDEELRELHRKLTHDRRSAQSGVRATPGSNQASTATDDDEVVICGVPVRTADLLELGEQIALLEAYTNYGVPFDPTPVADALGFFVQAAEKGLPTRASRHSTRSSEYKQALDEIAAALQAMVEERLGDDQGMA